MGRTNVVVDDELLAKVMRLYRLPTKRAAIDFALRRLVPEDDPRKILELLGTGWPGDLDDMRSADPVQEL
jgi:Arc/MetJ family transcription regulator